MKQFITYLIVAFILCGCSKVADKGPYTIEGRLLNNCEEQEPIANTLLYFLVDYDMPEEERIAYTDDQGYFKYSYEGPGNNESVIGGSIRLSSDNPVLCGIPNFPSDRNMDAGVVYKNVKREAEITFKITGEGFTEEDTLILASSFHTDLRKISPYRIAGPFENKVIVKEEWIKYASSGIRSMGDWIRETRPFVRRLHGTFGTSVYWQIIDANGSLGEVEKEWILLEACENEGVIEIDLDEGS